jgi:hypothetical protein
MRLTNSRKQFMKPMRKDSSARMHAEVDMTLMYTFTQAQELTSVEKNQHLLNPSRANPEDPD